MPSCSSFLKRANSLTTYDEVVEETDAHGGGGCLQRLGYLAVVCGGSRIAARVVVRENEATGLMSQGSFDYLSYIDDGLVYRAALQALRHRHSILGVDECHVDLFLRMPFQLSLEIGRCFASGAKEDLLLA